MITITNLIDFLSNYKTDSKYTFYNNSIEMLKNLQNKNIVNNKIIKRFQRKSYILEPLRIYLLENKHNIFLSNKKNKSCNYIKYKLTDLERDNFLTLIVLSEEFNSNILKLKEINTDKIKNILNGDNIYLNICKESVNLNNELIYNIKNLYDSLSFLLGIESIRILKYQRLDRIKEFLNNPEAYKVFEILQSYNNYIHTLSNKDRDDYIIHSGSILEAIGTTYTRDVDVIVNKYTFNPEDAKTHIKFIQQYGDIDINIIDKNGDYYTKINEPPLKYKKSWLTYQLPASDGALDIYDVIINPVFNFCFAGMKLMNLNLTFNRFLTRASISSTADLLMLYDINKIDIRDKICLPNMTVRQGRLVVFFGDYLEKFFVKLEKVLLEYYNKKYSVDELRKLIKHCNVAGYDIYKGPMIKDPDTDIIKYFHIMIKRQILYKYANNCKNLLDVGSGKLTDMRLWDEAHVQNVVGIEPSIESIEMGNERIKKFGFKGTINIINGTGDTDWKKEDKYKIIFDNIYNVVTFQFTLHYMMNNINVVMNNLKSIVKSGTKIIITCMDGNKIQSDFKKFGKVEVRNKQEPIFAIVPFYKVTDVIPEVDNNILVYFKGAFGVSSGSLEPIIDINKLIKIFEDNQYKLVERRNFADYNIPVKNKLQPQQLKVSSYYMSIIFEKI
jgi:ubiquinone/menaquinone biosynthesis C-methylase UbiE